MKCKRIEELLPAFAEGDLAEKDRVAVEGHVQGCELCSQSLAFYSQLEANLTGRRTHRPSSRTAATVAVQRLGLREPSIFSGLRSWPGYAAALFILLGVALLFRGDLLARLSVVFGGSLADGLTAGLQNLANGADAVSAGNEIMMLTVYLGVAAVILLSGSWTVLRFVRE